MPNNKATRNKITFNKRIKKASKTTSKHDKMVTPKRNAFDYIISETESLHPTFTSILSTQAKDRVRLFHHLKEKEQQLEKWRARKT